MSAAPVTYGGQAVIEGVVIRGQRTVALACRRPDGAIYRYREPLRSPLARSRAARAPFVRGMAVLGETLSLGVRMLQRSAAIQLQEDESKEPPGTGLALVAAAAFAVVVFVGVPYAGTSALRPLVPSALALNIAEGVVRLGLFLGYLALIARLPEIRRVFAYHGAEHMTIHAYERGDPLEVARVRPYPTAHPRCGTAFLLIVAVIAIALFAFLPRGNPLLDLVLRLALVLPIASLSYEALRLGARHEGNPLVRPLLAPGLLLQRITTRRPDDGMIEVAIASLEEALAGDREQAA